MNALLVLTVGFTAVPQYSVMDSMLANTLLIQGIQLPQKLIENMVKSQPNVIYALRDQALREEILDQKETAYYFAKHDELVGDIRLISQRFICLQNAPKIADVQYLPTLEACRSGIEFNRKYNETLEQRALIETDRRDAFQEAIEYNRKHYELWDAMRDARSTFNNVSVRRFAMAKIIKEIGEEDFYNSKFPACVPLWQFVEE